VNARTRARLGWSIFGLEIVLLLGLLALVILTLPTYRTGPLQASDGYLNFLLVAIGLAYTSIGVLIAIRAGRVLGRLLRAVGVGFTLAQYSESGGVGRYAPEAEATAYFCCLEALNNVAKYAGASRVQVRLEADATELRFSVSDDGSGFDPAAHRDGTGLQGMRDRLSALGGRLEIQATPGAGVTVSGSIPAIEPGPNG